MPKPHWHIVIGRSQGVGGAAVEEDEAAGRLWQGLAREA